VAYIRGGEGLADLEVADDDERAGVRVVARALEEPLRCIAENGGVEGSIVVNTVRASTEKNFGFNAAKGVYEDLVAAGVIDPAMVARVALIHAVSIAGLLLTTAAMVGRHLVEPATSSGPRRVNA
jgi:chaperonin GroEL